jgi:hypothetical protein
MLNVTVAVAVLVPSVAVTVTWALEAAVGVPKMTPSALTDTPDGSCPALNENVGFPAKLLWVKLVTVRAVPAAPLIVTLAGLSEGGAATMLNVTVAVAVFVPSVAVTVTWALEAAFGVPMMLPSQSMITPDGNPLAVNVGFLVKPLWEKLVAVRAVPTVPLIVTLAGLSEAGGTPTYVGTILLSSVLSPKRPEPLNPQQ